MADMMSKERMTKKILDLLNLLDVTKVKEKDRIDEVTLTYDEFMDIRYMVEEMIPDGEESFIELKHFITNVWLSMLDPINIGRGHPKEMTFKRPIYGNRI